MPVFDYKGWDAKGKRTQGSVDADGPQAARVKLKRAGIYTIELKQQVLASDKSLFTRIAQFKGKASISSRELSVATRQLSTLVRGGLPLITALNALIDQVGNENLSGVFTDVRERINEGASFADALEAHPKVFTSLFISMVRAGETSGALDVVLERLSEFLEGQEELRGKILSALIYPIVMLIVGSGVVIFMVTYVIPQVQVIFEETQQALPLPTTILLATTGFLRHWGWAVVLAAIGGYYALRRYIGTDVGREKWDRLRIRMPIFGNLSLVISTSRFARTLSTLLSSGVPLIRGLDIVEHVMGNVLLSTAIRESRDAIAEGADFAGPLKASGMFPPIVVHMIAVGEKTGELENMLMHLADAYDTEVEIRIRALTSLMEPVLLLIMGVVIGFVVVSVLLPIFQMTQGF